MHGDGKYVYRLTVSGDEFDKLDANELLEDETFNIRITDEHGAYTDGVFQVTFQGERDAFLIEADALKVTENDGELSRDTGVSLSNEGVVRVEGVDNADSAAIADNNATWNVQNGAADGNGHIAVEGQYGRFVLDPATGEYHYELDNAKVQDWNAGKRETETFTVEVTINGETQTKVVEGHSFRGERPA